MVIRFEIGCFGIIWGGGELVLWRIGGIRVRGYFRGVWLWVGVVGFCGDFVVEVVNFF